MILSLLFGLLLFALLALVLALYLLDNQVNKQSKRLQNLIGDTQSLNQSQNEALNHGSSSCQMCHVCGGLRLRSTQASVSKEVFNDVKSLQSLGITQFAASNDALNLPYPVRKARFAVSIKQSFQKLMRDHKRQTQEGFWRSWGVLSKILRLMGSKSVHESMPVVPACVSTMDSMSFLGSALESSSDDMLSAAASNLSMIESDSMVFSGSSSLVSDDLDKIGSELVQRNTDLNLKGAPIHRLVLEILMSPDGKPLNSCSTGLMLKLEANTKLEHPAGSTEALKSKGIQTREHNAKNSNAASVLCLPNGQGLQTSSPSSDDGVLSAGGKEKCLETCPHTGQKGIPNTIGKAPLFTRECCHASQRMVLADSHDCDRIGHSFCSNIEQESVGANTLGGAIGAVTKDSTVSTLNGQLKFNVTNLKRKNITSDSKGENMDGCPSVSEVTPVVPSNSLGSLHISILKVDAKGNLQDEGVDKVHGQAGSPLSALNVTSKLVENGGGPTPDHTKKEKSYKNPVTSCNLSRKSGVGFGNYKQMIVGGDDHDLSQASTDGLFNDDSSLSTKKEKKKKKNKGKKLKVTTGAAVADAQEMLDIGKIAFQAVKHVSAVPEREIGCVCGAPKGDLHTESCPYPFTSSGSMLQKKIKEQYNDLVRSNAAKSLTLAQVGQFTSCLVEAKATLQQKSELIQRKFTIAKSLLSKADKSSFDRLCEKIYGLEMEQKKLEEDTVVYNRLQEQLKLSPAYKKMLEYGRTHFELQPHTGQMIEKLEPEEMDMSFEELLAQEKKDPFWQRHSLGRSVVRAS